MTSEPFSDPLTALGFLLYPSYTVDTFDTSFIIRDQMFLPFPIGADRNSLNKFFRSAPYDISPWITLDLGSVRIVNSVQMSQDASRALSGNHFNC
jgi:hypothetical protein